MKKLTSSLNNKFSNMSAKSNFYDFRAIDYKKVCNFNGPQHEQTHKKVQEVSSGRVFAIMSSYKNKTNKFLSIKISDIKMNGTFFPKKDPIKNSLITDCQGNSIPDPEKGGQHLLGLENPRIVLDSDIIVDHAATEYCKAHKKKKYQNFMKIVLKHILLLSRVYLLVIVLYIMKMVILFLMLMEKKLIIKNMLRKMIKNIYVLLGLSFVMYIVYLRLILQRLPMDLQSNISLIKLVIYFILSILFIGLFINAVHKFVKKEEKVSLLNKTLNYFHGFLRKSLMEFYQFLKGILVIYFNIGQWHESLGIWFLKHFNSNNKIFCLLLVFDVLPKVILVLSLFIDVFYFKRFCYFYKLSFLFLCPLVLIFLEYTFERFCRTNIEYFTYPLYIRDKINDKVILTNDLFIAYCENDFSLDLNNYEFRLQNFFMENHKHLDYSVENTTNSNREALTEIYFPMRALFLKVSLIKINYNKYLNIFIYGLYAIIWVYVFFFSL